MKVGIKMAENTTPEVEMVEVAIHDNNRDIIGKRTVGLVVANNDREDGIVFNTVEVPVVYTDSTTEEEEAATAKARQLALEGDI